MAKSKQWVEVENMAKGGKYAHSQEKEEVYMYG